MKESEESEVTQSCPTLCDPMDYIACQAPPSMGFPRQEYWSGLPLPSPGDLPDPGINPTSIVSPALQADSLPLALPGKCLSLSWVLWMPWRPGLVSVDPLEPGHWPAVIAVDATAAPFPAFHAPSVFCVFLSLSLCAIFWVTSSNLPSSSMIFPFVRSNLLLKVCPLNFNFGDTYFILILWSFVCFYLRSAWSL